MNKLMQMKSNFNPKNHGQSLNSRIRKKSSVPNNLEIENKMDDRYVFLSIWDIFNPKKNGEK